MSAEQNNGLPEPSAPTPMNPRLEAYVQAFDDLVTKIAVERLTSVLREKEVTLAMTAMILDGTADPLHLPDKIRTTMTNVFFSLIMSIRDKRTRDGCLTAAFLTARMVAAIYEQDAHTIEVDHGPTGE